MSRSPVLSCLALVALASCATAPPAITHRRSGAVATLESLHGKVVVVNFWAEWCKPCISEIPDVARAVDALGSDVLLLPVYYRPEPSRGQLTPWLDAQPAYFRDRVCFANGSFLSGYRLEAIPQTFVYDRRGREVAHFQGALRGERLGALTDAVRTALDARVESASPGR